VNVRSERLRSACLYLVCGLTPPSLVDAAIDGGVQIVQLRLKDVADGELLAAARELAAVCSRRGVLFVVNDRPELVGAAPADGVHLGQDDLAPAQARALVGPQKLIGRSTHTPEQVDAAMSDPDVDYLGVGPVYATPTKPGRPAVGLELVRYAASHAGGKPWFAIGGIDGGNAGAVIGSGARRLAVVRAIAQAAEPERVARELRAALAAAEVGVGAA
jgi:thiamine-phosphate pyrophosphorylase